MDLFFIALVETASNQKYIFQSNKLREVLGASDLVRRVGVAFAKEALDPFDAADHRPVVLTSGKAVVLFRRRADAEAFVFAVTRRALGDAPGLGVFGAVSEEMSKHASADEAAKAMERLFRRVASNRLHLTDPTQRFPFQPIVRPCATSGLPAEDLVHTDSESAMARAKRKARDTARDHLAKQFPDVALADPDTLEAADLGWYGVVHADGNGFGQVFMNLARYLPQTEQSALDYFTLYNRLSTALDAVGIAATRRAMASVKPVKLDGKRVLPIVPLVLGGDDLTVLVAGGAAFAFARAYVAAFEELVDSDPVIGGLARHDNSHFGVGVGVAIVKPHHPFHRAYDLAEALIRSAKGVKDILGPGASTIDFHVVYGDSASDLDQLRGSWTVDDGTTRLTARPYVFSDEGRFRDGADTAWAARHAWTALETARANLNLVVSEADADGQGRAAFPRSQQHVLRTALFDGRATADAALQLFAHRYADVKFGSFGADGGLFFADATAEPDKPLVHLTRLVDAMDLNDVINDADHDEAPNVKVEQTMTAELEGEAQ